MRKNQRRAANLINHANQVLGAWKSAASARGKMLLATAAFQGMVPLQTPVTKDKLEALLQWDDWVDTNLTADLHVRMKAQGEESICTDLTSSMAKAVQNVVVGLAMMLARVVACPCSGDLSSSRHLPGAHVATRRVEAEGLGGG